MTAAVPSRGMQLGKKTRPNDFVQAMQAELPPQHQENSPLLQATSPVAAPPAHYPTASSSSSSGAPDRTLAGSDVLISIEEQIAMIANRDGGLKSLEVKGELNVIVNNANCHRIKIQTALAAAGDIQFKVLLYSFVTIRIATQWTF